LPSLEEEEPTSKMANLQVEVLAGQSTHFLCSAKVLHSVSQPNLPNPRTHVGADISVPSFLNIFITYPTSYFQSYFRAFKGCNFLTFSASQERFPSVQDSRTARTFSRL
jgi:hypothetical protein